MSRDRRRTTAQEMQQEDWVETRVTNFLAKLSHKAAVTTSVKVAVHLADLWDIERIEMDRRGDQRLVYLIRDTDRHWLASAVAASDRSFNWASCPHEYVSSMLTDDLPVDVTARVACRVAQWICRKERF